MSHCPNCEAEVGKRTEKNLKGRTSSKSVPQECPECGHALTNNQTDPSILRK